MNPLIETPRLLMREFALSDAQAVYEFSSDPEVCRWTGDELICTLADAENIIRNTWLAEYKKYGYARYALIHKADDKVIGFSGIKFEPSLNAPDIGYRMLPQYWGKGLGLEAAQATLDYAYKVLKLEKVVAEAVVENVASNRILQKIGLKLVDTYEKDGFMINLYN